MAEKTRSNSRSNKKSTSKKSTSNRRVSTVRRKNPLQNEVEGVILISLAVFIFVCLFAGYDTAVPSFIQKAFLGVFGYAAYLLPFLLAAIGLFRIILKKITIHKGKLISTIFFVLSLFGAIHCIFYTGYEADSYGTAIANTFNDSSAGIFSMGVFATLYVYPLYALVSKALTVVIMLSGIAVTVILLFNFSYKAAGEKIKEKIDIISEHTATALRKKDPPPMFDDIIDERLLKPKKRKRERLETIEEDDSETAVKITPNQYSEPEFFGNESQQPQNEDKAAPEPAQAFEPAESAEAEEPAPVLKGEFETFVVPKEKKPVYKLPPLSLLNPPVARKGSDRVNYQENSIKLQDTLKSFGINAKVENITIGPAITRYEISIESGTRFNRILALADDIALSMATAGVRIAPIPGKSVIGIEIPNSTVSMVTLRECLESDAFRNSKSCVSFALGKDISGNTKVADISKMPHLLIAGQTGSGKSVAINSLIMSILYKSTPEEVRLILVDPKKVELSMYNGIPNLLLPVVTDPRKAAGALQYVVRQMENRYNEFGEKRVKDINRYNELCVANGWPIMPRIVVIVDELNDLMMVAQGEVEDSVMRIAQLARAAGIYLVLATQRPSVNVITGVIKANIPSRMAFAVASSHDSRTILDMVGAEKLMGRGDMLYHHNGESKPERIQGAYVDETEVERVVEYIKKTATEPEYISEDDIEIVEDKDKKDNAISPDEEMDELFDKAVGVVIDNAQASISLLQRKLGIGYARAGRLIDIMESMGIVSASAGSKPRDVLMNREQYYNRFKKQEE